MDGGIYTKGEHRRYYRWMDGCIQRESVGALCAPRARGMCALQRLGWRNIKGEYTYNNNNNNNNNNRLYTLYAAAPWMGAV